MNRVSLNFSVRSNFVDFVYAVSKFHEKQRKEESTDISRFGVFVGIYWVTTKIHILHT